MNAMTNPRSSPTERKPVLDINNNVVFVPEYDTSTPLSGNLRNHRRLRPDGESPEKSEEEPTAKSSPLNVSEETDDGRCTDDSQQRLLNAYYTELMWQSYYASLATMMGPGLQQQMALLKLTGQKTPESPSFRAEPCRTRIDMDEFKAELSAMTELYRACMTIGDSNIERAASTYRSAATAPTRSHTVHWEGCLQVSHPLSVTFSRKVFVGGVPWDIREQEFAAALRDVGHFELLWPQNRERRTVTHRGGQSVPRGYCYIVFNDESQVKALLQKCVPRDGASFLRLSNRSGEKDTQVIPWCIGDASFAARGLHSANAKTTVFVGALHGMITAANLATIMSDTFGDVVCAALDTDRYKYPIGSGRVVFATSESYKKAVEANFLQVKTPKFVKTIQIDPYLEDSMCSVCFYAPGVYFCRSTKCFQYYCPPCWQAMHSAGEEERGNHKPLRRTFRNPIDRKYM